MSNSSCREEYARLYYTSQILKVYRIFQNLLKKTFDVTIIRLQLKIFEIFEIFEIFGSIVVSFNYIFYTVSVK